MNLVHKKAWTLITSAIAVGLVVLVTLSVSAGPTLTPQIAAQSQSIRRAAPAANNTANIPLTVDCATPVFTIELSIDRSEEIIATPSFGGQTQEQVIKASTKRFLDQLYQKIVVPNTANGGTVNVLLNAVASMSVAQNRVDGAGKKIIAITDAASLSALQQDVDNIYFKPGNGHVSATNPYGVSDPSNPSLYKYGYNPPGLLYTNYDTTYEDPALKENDMGKANFDDALLEVAKEASSSTWNNAAAGKHIDMSLVLAAGRWANWDHADRTYDSKTDRLVDTSSARVTAAKNTVNALRTGTAVPSTPYVSRPAMASRAIYFATFSNIFQDLEGVWGTISGNMGHAYALNAANNPTAQFGPDLNTALDKVVNSITMTGSCPIVTPPTASISLTALNPDGTPLASLINVQEGIPQNIVLRVSNTSTVKLYNVQIKVNGSIIDTQDLDGGITLDKSSSINIALGELPANGGNYIFDVQGTTSGGVTVSANTNRTVSVLRSAMPA